MFCMLKKKNISYLMFQNITQTWKKKVIIIMIWNREIRAAKFEGREIMTSENNVDFYCLDCLPSFRAKSKLELHKRACANKDFCSVNMTSEITKLLEFNQYQKSGKTPFIIYADLECIIEKINGCTNNHENSSTTKVSKHIPSSFSMPTKSLFRSRENKHNVYRGKDYMKKFSEFLKEHAMKIINFKKKKK